MVFAARFPYNDRLLRKLKNDNDNRKVNEVSESGVHCIGNNSIEPHCEKSHDNKFPINVCSHAQCVCVCVTCVGRARVLVTESSYYS